MSPKRPFVPKSDVKQIFTTTTTSLCLCFILAKYLSIIDDFVIGGGNLDFLYNHLTKKMGTVFLLIYGL